MDEWKIVVSDPLIQSTVHNIVKDETSVYSILSAINDWMVEHIAYPSETQI